jgi:hypothetical protein
MKFVLIRHLIDGLVHDLYADLRESLPLKPFLKASDIVVADLPWQTFVCTAQQRLLDYGRASHRVVSKDIYDLRRLAEGVQDIRDVSDHPVPLVTNASLKPFRLIRVLPALAGRLVVKAGVGPQIHGEARPFQDFCEVVRIGKVRRAIHRAASADKRSRS